MNPVTTTLYFSWSTQSVSGITGYIVSYRLINSPTWTQFSTSGTTAAISGLAINRIYSYNVETIAVSGNFQSANSSAINITDPTPFFSPVSNSISFSFNNLSVDMDSYVTTIALAATPSIIIATHMLSPSGIITDTFTNLSALTQYVITITPAANQFYKTFSYPVTTTLLTTCPAPLNAIASLQY